MIKRNGKELALTSSACHSCTSSAQIACALRARRTPSCRAFVLARNSQPSSNSNPYQHPQTNPPRPTAHHFATAKGDGQSHLEMELLSNERVHSVHRFGRDLVLLARPHYQTQLLSTPQHATRISIQNPDLKAEAERVSNLHKLGVIRCEALGNSCMGCDGVGRTGARTATSAGTDLRPSRAACATKGGLHQTNRIETVEVSALQEAVVFLLGVWFVPSHCFVTCMYCTSNRQV